MNTKYVLSFRTYSDEIKYRAENNQLTTNPANAIKYNTRKQAQAAAEKDEAKVNVTPIQELFPGLFKTI